MREATSRGPAGDLLVTYHHMVFTLPHVLNPWIEVHDRELYSLLVRGGMGNAERLRCRPPSVWMDNSV